MSAAGGGRFAQRPRVRIGAVLALAAAAAFVTWLLVGNNGSSEKPSATTAITSVQNATGPEAVTQKQLAALAKKRKHPIYWVGKKPGYTYEATETSNGNLYVRYLPPGVKVGNKRPDFLIIATYPFPKALSALKKVAEGRALPLRGGGIALVDKGYPKSVHLAFPGVDYQVEVYDPSPSRSLRVARSGAVRPVG